MPYPQVGSIVTKDIIQIDVGQFQVLFLLHYWSYLFVVGSSLISLEATEAQPKLISMKSTEHMMSLNNAVIITQWKTPTTTTEIRIYLY